MRINNNKGKQQRGVDGFEKIPNHDPIRLTQREREREERRRLLKKTVSLTRYDRGTRFFALCLVQTETSFKEFNTRAKPRKSRQIKKIKNREKKKKKEERSVSGIFFRSLVCRVRVEVLFFGTFLQILDSFLSFSYNHQPLLFLLLFLPPFSCFPQIR